MAESRGVGGGYLVGDEGGHAAGSSDFSSVGQHLSTLRARPVGGSMAEEGGARGRSDDPLRRRLRHGGSGAGGSRAIPGGVAGAAAEVRPGAPSGKDPADRVRAKA